MKDFVELFSVLDQTKKSSTCEEALTAYFGKASDSDKLWAIALLSEHRLRRLIPTGTLKSWVTAINDLPEWLFEESFNAVGDLSETIALILPKPENPVDQNLSFWINFIIMLQEAGEEEKKAGIFKAWDSLDAKARFVFNKLITGGWRMKVPQKTMVTALAKSTGVNETLLAHRLMSNWTPEETTFIDLFLSENAMDAVSTPFPFCLINPLNTNPDELGNPNAWQAERKWNGLRCQIILRQDEIFIWSERGELITNKCPEFDILSLFLPSGTLLDGEILPFKDGKVLPFSLLQSRMGRKNISKKLLEEIPVVFLAFDLLESEGLDIRDKSLTTRRKKLETLLNCHQHTVLVLSPEIRFSDWAALKQANDDSRLHRCQGIMLKPKKSEYQKSNQSDWLIWKAEPLTINAVMIYAIREEGQRSNLYTNFTFAVWKGETLIPFTKAGKGLEDEEYEAISTFVKENTVERFGPVRSVKPELVFQLCFDEINTSKRHKSGVVLQTPRIIKWYKEKPPNEANTYKDLIELLSLYG